MRQWHPACDQLARRQHLIRVESLGVNALADGDARNRWGAQTVTRGDLAHRHLARHHKATISASRFTRSMMSCHQPAQESFEKSICSSGFKNSSPLSLFSSCHWVHFT